MEENLVVLNIHNTYNYGTAIMGINFIYYFQKYSKKQITYYSRFLNNVDYFRMVKETGNKNIKCLNIMPKYNILPSYICNPLFMVSTINSLKPNGVIFLGGDEFSEHYSTINLLYNLYLIKKLSKNVPVVLFGQSIGPFNFWKSYIAKKCLNESFIYARDPITTCYLIKKLNLKNITNSYDLAFLDMPHQNDTKYRKLVDQLNLKDYVTIIPSGLYKKYTNNLNEYIKFWVKVIHYLLDDVDGIKKIVLLSHVNRGFSDSIIIDHIMDKIDKKHIKKVFPITKLISPTIARLIIGNGLFTISGRMHGAINSYQMGVPAIAFSYGIKYKGVLGKTLCMDELILDIPKRNWTSEKMLGLLKTKIIYIEQNKKSIKKILLDKINENNKLLIKHIKEIIMLMGC